MLFAYIRVTKCARAFNQRDADSHLDKVPVSERSVAHAKFQELALAYAILSDSRRKRRYDATGSTAESLDIEDDEFDWTSFFRAQYADLVTVDKINDLKTEYQGSEEEIRDVLAAYTATKGKMKGVYERVMMSNMLTDEVRFRRIIDGAIDKGMVDGYTAYLDETQKQKERRMKRALKEQGDAEEHAKKLGIYDQVFTSNRTEETIPTQNTKKASNSSEGELAALIQQRVKGRMENFLDSLEEKYAGNSRKGGRGKRNGAVVLDEPPEEAFDKMAKRGKKGAADVDKLLQETSARAAKNSKKRPAEAMMDETPEDVDEEEETSKKRRRLRRMARKKADA